MHISACIELWQNDPTFFDLNESHLINYGLIIDYKGNHTSNHDIPKENKLNNVHYSNYLQTIIMTNVKCGNQPRIVQPENQIETEIRNKQSDF